MVRGIGSDILLFLWHLGLQIQTCWGTNPYLPQCPVISNRIACVLWHLWNSLWLCCISESSELEQAGSCLFCHGSFKSGTETVDLNSLYRVVYCSLWSPTSKAAANRGDSQSTPLGDGDRFHYCYNLVAIRVLPIQNICWLQRSLITLLPQTEGTLVRQINWVEKTFQN